jgi:ubiquinone biosynthesis protein COQ4
MHDLWHILTGYGRDPVGETCLVAFSFAQTRSPGLAVISLLGLFKISRALRGAPIRAALFEAFRHGAAAAWLAGEDFEAALREPLEGVRTKLGIAPPARYREIMDGLADGRLVPVTAHP